MRSVRKSHAQIGGLCSCAICAQFGVSGFDGGDVRGFSLLIFSRRAENFDIFDMFVRNFSKISFLSRKVSFFCRIREYSTSSRLLTILYADLTRQSSFSTASSIYVGACCS